MVMWKGQMISPSLSKGLAVRVTRSIKERQDNRRIKAKIEKLETQIERGVPPKKRERHFEALVTEYNKHLNVIRRFWIGDDYTEARIVHIAPYTLEFHRLIVL